MTAKEYIEQETHDRMIVFERSQFKDFCIQLCKEQRQICAKSYKASDWVETSECEQNILNAKQPDI